MKKIILIISVLFSSFVFADSCEQLVPYGYPKTPIVNTTPLCRIAYFVSHDNIKKVPVYAAEYLIKENISNTVERKDAFKADPSLLKGQRAELTDYDKKYDRGHMAPFEDTARNSAAGLQSFYLSNMCPQDLHLNRGLWKTLENKTRAWAINSVDGVYVITGPIFTARPAKIGTNKVYVPKKFYKIIIDKSTGQGIAFIIPNVSPVAGKTIKDYAVNINDVEEATQINFTPTLPVNALTLKDRIGKQFSTGLK